MLKKQNCCGASTSSTFASTAAAAAATTTSSSPGAAVVGMHKNSQIITKVKPKIRIIHIFAPEIIKTDVANFRELVQRLTGKPTAERNGSSNNMMITKKKRPINGTTSRISSTTFDQSSSRCKFSTNNFTHHHHPMAMIHNKPFTTKLELIRSGFLKGEEEIWRNANSGGGFLGGFAELEGFMEQLNHEFPLMLPTMPLDAFGQSQLA